MLRLLAATLLVVACTPAAPALPSSSAAPVASTSPSVAVPTAAVTLPPIVTAAPSTTSPSPVPVASGCDPYYGNCEDKYTPRPTANVQDTPAPAGDDLVIGTSDENTYLVDADGMSLYTFDNDAEGQSSCSGDCADAWPPLTIVDGDRVVAGDGAVGEFTTFERNNGSTQVAYNGRALYYYQGDREPGDTNGQGIGEVWFLALP